jgi:mRNA interferase MazF
MPPTTSFEFGDVLLVPFPFTDQSSAKRRPAVVVSSADYARRRSDIILMPITSQVRSQLGFGETLVADWQTAGLLVPGVVKPLLASLERSLVLRRLGRLSPRDRSALGESLRQILGP